jgi:hypothetical protein
MTSKKWITTYFNKNYIDNNWLSMLRIGVAITLILKILIEFKDSFLIYGSYGIVQNTITEKLDMKYKITFYQIYPFFKNFLTEPEFLTVFFLVYIFFAILLLIGLKTKIVAIVCWLFHVLLLNNSPLTSYGLDSFLLSLLFYCCIFPVHLSWSVDYWRKPILIDENQLKLFLIFIQLNLCIVYATAGLSKLEGQTWSNGDAIWFAITQPQFFSRFTMPLLNFLSTYPLTVKFLTWGTLVLEISYAIFIWIKNIRVAFFFAIIMMHLFIGVIMQLYLFSLIMIVFNLTAFGNQILIDFKEFKSISKDRINN